MTSPGNETLFDPEAVAAQIRAQTNAIPRPAQADTERPPAGHATPTGRLPDTLTDRGNAKLFVRLGRVPKRTSQERGEGLGTAGL
ncbi:hypothetical protein [Streptomyces canus]|uniref:hypothetical protein n=1 Tax=Streptomyces canus TaxID=58343 RepID=UPI003866743E